MSKLIEKFSNDQTEFEGSTLTAQSAFEALAKIRENKAEKNHWDNFRLVLGILGNQLTNLSKAPDEDLKTFINNTPVFPALTFGLLIFSFEKYQDDDGKPVLRTKWWKRYKGGNPSFL